MHKHVIIVRGGDNMKKGVMMQGFEWYLPSSPHLWKILRVNAYKLKKAGITAIWLPPAYKGANGSYGLARWKVYAACWGHGEESSGCSP